MSYTLSTCVTEIENYIFSTRFGAPRRSVGIVRSRTQTMEFFFFWCATSEHMYSAETGDDYEVYCNISRCDTPLMEICAPQTQIVIMERTVISEEVTRHWWKSV
jgi:hypothetical protein